MVRDLPLIPDLDEEVLKAVGRVTVAFSGLDYVLRLYVKSLLSAGFKVGMVVAAQQRYIPGLCDLAFSLFKLKVDDSTAIRDFQKLLNRAMACSEKRNVLMHSFWTIAQNEVHLVRPTAKKGQGLRHGGGAVTAKELQQFTKRLSSLARELDDHRMNRLPALLKMTARTVRHS